MLVSHILDNGIRDVCFRMRINGLEHLPCFVLPRLIASDAIHVENRYARLRAEVIEVVNDLGETEWKSSFVDNLLRLFLERSGAGVQESVYSHYKTFMPSLFRPFAVLVIGTWNGFENFGHHSTRRLLIRPDTTICQSLCCEDIFWRIEYLGTESDHAPYEASEVLTFVLSVITSTDLSYGTGDEKIKIARVEGSVKQVFFGYSHTLFVHVLGLLVPAIEEKILLRWSVNVQ